MTGINQETSYLILLSENRKWLTSDHWACGDAHVRRSRTAFRIGSFGRLSVGVGIVERLVLDELWELFQRVVPEAPSRSQGGGRRRHGDREVLAAIVFVATSGCPGRQFAFRVVRAVGGDGSSAICRLDEGQGVGEATPLSPR
ncbi:transposase [Streptomyces chryseus]|uniref:transposase n=1 Tax=Streptomyces chryseus TaxID=68186 RepID=UPI001E357091|nr:transposase [Streptomyces chryseus]